MSNAWIDAQERSVAWPLRYRAGKDLPDGTRLVVTAGLHRIGEQDPYWSVTAELIDRGKQRGGDVIAAGCMPEISEHFPELAPVVALHLSSEDGVPMHAYHNAVFFMGLTKFKDHNGKPLPDVDILARHLRISAEEAHSLCKRHHSDTRALEEDIMSHRARWARESADAKALLARLIAGQSETRS